MSYRFLNVGGGNFCQREDGWANLDCPFERYLKKRKVEFIDIVYDLMLDCPMPIQDNSFDVVYSSHTIEHLPAASVERIFSEINRILVPGGVFRVSCPDADKFFDSISGKSGVPISSYWSSKGVTGEKELFFDALFSHLWDKIGGKEFRRIAALPRDEFFADIDLTMSWYPVSRESQNENPSRHISYWHFDRLKSVMATAGFVDIERKERNESAHEILRKSYIDKTAPECSIFVEGRKS